jgi:hypothetical protein
MDVVLVSDSMTVRANDDTLGDLAEDGGSTSVTTTAHFKGFVLRYMVEVHAAGRKIAAAIMTRLCLGDANDQSCAVSPTTFRQSSH